MELKGTNGLIIPSSEKDVEILNKVLEIVKQKQLIMEKDILSLCNGDSNQSSKIKHCLIDSEAVKPALNWGGRLNIHPTNTNKYLEINYFDMLYKTNKEEKEKKEMEYTMLKEEINLTKKQAKLSTPAFFISLAALIIAIIELCLG